jgi:hypothetical protein
MLLADFLRVHWRKSAAAVFGLLLWELIVAVLWLPIPSFAAATLVTLIGVILLPWALRAPELLGMRARILLVFAAIAVILSNPWKV